MYLEPQVDAIGHPILNEMGMIHISVLHISTIDPAAVDLHVACCNGILNMEHRATTQSSLHHVPVSF